MGRLAKVSKSAKAFITACLQKDSTKRPTMAELLDFEWFKTVKIVGDLTEDQQLNISANLADFTKTTAF